MQKKHKKRKVTEKHGLGDDSDKELDQIRGKYCTRSRKMGKKMTEIKNDEKQKKRIFIDEEIWIVRTRKRKRE